MHAFLSSNTGQKFLILINGVYYLNAIKGAENTANPVHAAGRTAGFGEAIKFLITQSQFHDAQPKPQKKQTEEEELVERMSP